MSKIKRDALIISVTVSMTVSALAALLLPGRRGHRGFQGEAGRTGPMGMACNCKECQ